jgi:hypothetical protein
VWPFMPDAEVIMGVVEDMDDKINTGAPTAK